jgi:uncharacterized membrane protein YhaH (DUF805 family)
MSESIYISRHGQQEGPYSLQQIETMLAEGSIARYSLGRTEGLHEWVPLSKILGPAPTRTTSTVPRRTHSDQALLIEYGGIGRLTYVGLWVVFMFCTTFIRTLESTDQTPRIVLFLILTLAWMIPTVLRLRNVGKSGWWALLSFIPIANLYIGFLCLLAPEGYAHTKKLDRPAILILAAVILIILIIATAAFLNR